jgi:hypothetical protein
MDKEQEEITVKSFFVKRIRERVMFELSSPKRRIDALSRLCHRPDITLIEKYMIEIPKPNSDPLDIEDLLKSYGAGNTCYVISYNKEIDGKHLPLRSALKSAVGFGMPSLISCIPGRLAYFEAEQENGPPPRYILKRDI